VRRLDRGDKVRVALLVACLVLAAIAFVASGVAR
jgi:hypothetical protein